MGLGTWLVLSLALALQRDTFQKLVAGSLGTTGDFDSVIKQRLEQGGV